MDVIIDVLFPGICYLIGPLAGLIGALVGGSFQKRILHDIGMDHYPKNPTEKYQLIAKHCPYASSWTRLDTYNLSLFLFGWILLANATIVSVIEMGKGKVVFVNHFPLNFPILIIATIFILLGGLMLVQRMIMIIKLIQIKEKPTEPIQDLKVPLTPAGKPGSTIISVLISLVSAVYSFATIYLVHANDFFYFWIVSVIFVIVIISFVFWEFKKRRKNT